MFQPSSAPLDVSRRTTATNVMATPLVCAARDCACGEFTAKLRKTPKGSELEPQPYYKHLHDTAVILAEHGFRPEVVAAGYLHDHIEDLPGWTKERVASGFGPEVAILVDYVTQQDKRLSWEERNAAYAERLREAPREALAVSAADKIANLRDTLVYLELGYPVSSFLKRGHGPNSEKLHQLAEIFEGCIIPDTLYRTFKDLVEKFDGAAMN